MPFSTRPTQKEEEEFMKALLSDLDNTFFDALPSSPDTHPVKSTPRHKAELTPNARSLENTFVAPHETRDEIAHRGPRRVPLAPVHPENRVKRVGTLKEETMQMKPDAEGEDDRDTLMKHLGGPTRKELDAYDKSDDSRLQRDANIPPLPPTAILEAVKPLSSPVKKPVILVDPCENRVELSASVLEQKNQKKSPDVQDVDMDALFAGAEDWDWEDMDVDDDPRNKLPKPVPPPALVPETCTRCVVEQVINAGLTEKRLQVKLDGWNVTEKREVILKQEWSQTDVVVGDIINVIGQFTPASSASNSPPYLTITITSRCNTLVLHPDLLLSATTIANAPSCTRKPLISALLSSNAPSPPSPTASTGKDRSYSRAPMVWGNFLHEVMQQCFEAGRWDKEWIEERIEDVVGSPDGIGELVMLGMGIEQARFEVRARAGGLEAFAKRFIGSSIKPEGRLTDLREANEVTSRLALTTLHDIEEDIWSPTYGLKGKLDASVQVLMQQTYEPATNKLNFHKPGHSDTRSWTAPFEIKTGQSIGVLEHRAQTMLYTLLMEERYGVEVPSGLLYYTQSEELMRVPAVRNELKGLLMTRNELASYVMRQRGPKVDDINSTGNDGQPFLPPTIDDSFRCTKCFAVDGCMLYRKAVENVVDESTAIAPLYNKKTSHLTLEQCSFFKKWEALVSLEEQDGVRFRKELWTLSAEERERTGRCFSKMVMEGYKHNTGPGVARVHQYIYHFIRAGSVSRLAITSSTSASSTTTSLLNSSISAGDAVTVSIEPDLLALARGFVVELDPLYVVVGFDHDINLAGILKRTRGIETAPHEVICRIDKDEFAGGMGRIRDNLARLFYAHGDSRRLSLVVDLAPPAFDDLLAPDQSELPANLNLNQRDAVRKVLSAKDYAIVLGMPGTGKTSTIAEIINVLVKRGKTVLLASYTHSAVDTILLKLDKADYPILRLGSLDKVHADVRKHTLAHQPRPATIGQLEHQILRPPVVATTCLSVDNALFARRYFDYCIIDEASQVTLPTCLGPLRYADKFVLVGDHFQLPPLVRNRDARAGGLDVSLFRRLVDAHPEAVVDLVYQYRMNEDIMLLSNKLIYSDRLRCGSNVVANRSLVLPDKTALKDLHTVACSSDRCWLEKLLDESCKAVFVDTDLVPGKESRVGALIRNEVEAKLVHDVTEALLLCGVDESQIGIISPYQQQLKLLSHLLHRHKKIELLTADKSQGRDKDCIIISMVRSNDSDQTGDLVKDWRRINVSFTRARSKLIIFGSRKTLCPVPVLGEFFQLMESKDWIVSLPPGADDVHALESSDVETIPSKKRAADNDLENKENHGPRIQRKTKKAKVDRGVLKGRPMLQDVVNNAL